MIRPPRESLAERRSANSKVDKGALFVLDTDHTSLESALSALATGGVLEVRTAWSRSTAWVVNKACTVQFRRGGQITQTGTGHGISVTASDVTLDRPKVIGTGSGTAGTARGISAVGTAATPITGLTLNRPDVSAWSQYGIYLEHCQDFRVTGMQVQNVAYSGLSMLSCKRGDIIGGSVRTVTQPAGFVNSYGIAMTRDSAASIATAPRTSEITVMGVTIDGVSSWEGIDTHGGADLTIVGNKVFDCRIGIALVPCPDAAGVDTYAPLRVVCVGNLIDSRNSAGARSDGIQIVGAGTPTSTVELATGVIANNVIIDHGLDNTAGSAGLMMYLTQGVVLSGNRFVRPGTNGIQLYYKNYDVALSGNVVEDAWSSGAYSAAVYVRSNDNTFTLTGLRVARGSKAAAMVNNRGLYFNSGALTGIVATDGGANNFEVCTTSVVDAGNFYSLRSHAKKLGLYGVTPVVRASAISSPTADVASLKTAVDAIRVALTNVGITS